MYELSIIIPVYNEPTLPVVVAKLIQATKSFNTQIIVVDDGSTDDTTEWLKSNFEQFSLIPVFHKKNKGKGAALKSAFAKTNGKVILVQDADLEYNPFDIPKVVLPILNGKTKVCYGSRYLDKTQLKTTNNWIKTHWNQSLLAFWGSKLITLLCNLLFNVQLTDVFTCYKAFDSKLLKEININSNGFEIETELTAKFLKQTSIIEISINYFPRTYQEGKKIKWIDGVKALITIFRYL